jgi:hypothetical protein
MLWLFQFSQISLNLPSAPYDRDLTYAKNSIQLFIFGYRLKYKSDTIVDWTHTMQ